jgi:hypothetical protein
MNEQSTVVVSLVVAGFLLVIAISLVVWLIKFILIGATCLLAYASESGFLGLALYVILWIIALPFMVITCAIIGYARNRLEKEGSV